MHILDRHATDKPIVLGRHSVHRSTGASSAAQDYHDISVILPIMLQFWSPNLLLQYFVSKISTSTEESVRLEILEEGRGRGIQE